MLNTLYIDATNNCECTLIGNVDDKTARLQLNIICDLNHSPQLEIVGGRTVKMTSNPYLVEFTTEEIQGSGTLQFRIVDDMHTGDYFNITKCKVLDSTLYIKQTDNFNYILSYISSGGGGTVDAYTKAETNELLESKADSDHNHNGTYTTPAELNVVKNEVNALDAIVETEIGKIVNPTLQTTWQNAGYRDLLAVHICELNCVRHNTGYALVNVSDLTNGNRTDALGILGIMAFSKTTGVNVISTTAYTNGTQVVVVFKDDIAANTNYPVRFVTIYFKTG